MIKSELKKSINIYLILFLIIVGFFVGISAMYDDISPSINITEGSDSESLSKTDIESLNKMAKQYQNTYMAWRFSTMGYEIICIILATLVYATTYLIDKKSGYLKNILLRVSKRKYFFNKTLVNFISGGLIVNIPLIICLIIYMIIFDNRSLPSIEAFLPKGFMSELFVINPILYIIFFSIVLFFIGGVYSTFAMAVGINSNNIIYGILTPIFYWYFGSIFFQSIGLDNLAPWRMYYFTIDESYSFIIPTIHTFIILAISLWIIYRESKSEQF